MLEAQVVQRRFYISLARDTKSIFRIVPIVRGREKGIPGQTMQQESLERNHPGGDVQQDSWSSAYGTLVVGEGERRRNHGEGVSDGDKRFD